MSKPLSLDLRERLVSAVEGRMSRRSAAKFFSVAPSTTIKWVDQKRRTGSVRSRARGGDHRSHHLEAHADEIVALAKDGDIPACRPKVGPVMPDLRSCAPADRDMTLAELVDYIRETHGPGVAPSTIWRLLDRPT